MVHVTEFQDRYKRRLYHFLKKNHFYIVFSSPNTGDEREELEIFYYYNVSALPVKWYSVI